MRTYLAKRETKDSFGFYRTKIYECLEFPVDDKLSNFIYSQNAYGHSPYLMACIGDSMNEIDAQVRENPEYLMALAKIAPNICLGYLNRLEQKFDDCFIMLAMDYEENIEQWVVIYHAKKLRLSKPEHYLETEFLLLLDKLIGFTDKIVFELMALSKKG